MLTYFFRVRLTPRMQHLHQVLSDRRRPFPWELGMPFLMKAAPRHSLLCRKKGCAGKVKRNKKVSQMLHLTLELLLFRLFKNFSEGIKTKQTQYGVEKCKKKKVTRKVTMPAIMLV